MLNYLGYSWVDMGLHLSEALDMIQTAVKLRPNDGYIIDSLGWAYFKLGRYQDAVDELENAVLQQADDPTINEHLGDAYWKVGRKLEATFQWAHARDLNPEKADLPVILAKLEHGLKDPPAEAPTTKSTETTECRRHQGHRQNQRRGASRRRSAAGIGDRGAWRQPLVDRQPDLRQLPTCTCRSTRRTAIASGTPT